MHVAILGAGALGRAYAACLRAAKCEITLVTRPSADTGVAPSGEVFVAKRVGLWSRRRQIDARILTEIPECDVVLVAVRAENVDDALLERIASCGAPAVVLTPMMSEHTASRWRAVPRAYGAMPSLVAEQRNGAVEFLVPPLSRTLIDLRAKSEPAIVDLARRLRKGGVGTTFAENLELDARATNLAFFPLQMAAAAVPDLRSWPQRRDVLCAVAGAQSVARQLARQLGSADLGVRLLAWLCSSPIRLGLLFRLGPKLSPFVFGFLEHHFGYKLPIQTEMFTQEVRELAVAKGLDDATTQRLLPPLLTPPRLPS